ncbi:M1 family metallopeptidase [Stakelama tenebrarum]|uniref:Aminopeptidase N n=1 Tax=Stakelama tenebrarum TaxID=2711215 RepID=A0A6G6Y8X6_9SPHN|nr:M1 family metallopeptidase [Sphingosinithalassobacter tenebrarum]QIG81026.1 M1 family metallopeptidase [Sphingosinithalassobacter tenebrarum]
MRKLISALALFLLAPLAAHAQTAPILTSPEAKDVWTHAQPEVARVTHVSLDLTADFDAKEMRGTATLDILAAADAKEIILDDAGLRIESITATETGKPLAWHVGEASEHRGAPLTIALPERAPTAADDAGESDGHWGSRITIRYASAPGASSLQWLAPEQTAGKEHPYLFSQGQAIENRSWIPTQDSPGIRQTWDATITVPADLVAVMSGDRVTPEGVAAGADSRSFHFEMRNPVPPYLIALAVGNLTFGELGPRSGVWTEPEMLDAALYEFADVEKMIDAASELYGPYRWGRYDMLLLPPSFPYGGMENPTLTFLTPTLLTGDRSNTDVVAHELAHSWSGNLVTNATWSDSWLNEGFTTYFENRIMEALYGKERAAMYSDLDWDGMIRDIEAAGGEDAPATRLRGEPGETFGQLDYFKGSNFLRMIEHTVGRERFDAYLAGYFDRYAFQPQTTAGFLADIREHLIQDDEALEEKLQLDRWAYQPGLPGNAIHIESATLAEVDADLEAFKSGAAVSSIDTEGWSTQEWLRFLNGLPRELPEARLAELDETLALSRSTNAYVRSAWLELAIANRYEPALPALYEFAGQVGRGLLIRPLYAGLMQQGDWGAQIARDVFEKSKTTYHPTTAGQIERMISADSAEE